MERVEVGEVGRKQDKGYAKCIYLEDRNKRSGNKTAKIIDLGLQLQLLPLD